MPRHTPNTNSFPRHDGGFTTIELLVMVTILTVITAFGFIGITKARASVRLSGAAREYATYVERARILSIRNHADDAGERATIAINDDKASYVVTMDIDGDGDMDTRTITLPSGITFDTVETISFDWRGRTLSTVGGITTPNAQVSIRLLNSDDSISIDVTGSGDVTIDSQVFDDSVPNVTLNVEDLTSGATPVPTATPAVADASPTPVPVGSIDPTDEVPTPTPILGDGGLPVPTPTPSSTPTPNPTPTPTPASSPTPTPVIPCTITTDPTTVIMGTQVSTTVKVSHTSDTTVAISATSSKPSDLQVTPASSQSVSAGSAGSFTLKSKKSLGTYSVTFSAGCGSKTVPVIVLL